MITETLIIQIFNARRIFTNRRAVRRLNRAAGGVMVQPESPSQFDPEQIKRIMRTEMLNLLYVGVGGLLGSIGRYLVAGAVYQIFPNSYFPIGTAVVNILGCFLIGFLNGLTELRQLLSPEMRIFLLIGLLGGFTTFSTFGYETIASMRTGEFVPALANVLLQVIVGLSAVWFGYSVARYF